MAVPWQLVCWTILLRQAPHQSLTYNMTMPSFWINTQWQKVNWHPHLNYSYLILHSVVGWPFKPVFELNISILGQDGRMDRLIILVDQNSVTRFAVRDRRTPLTRRCTSGVNDAVPRIVTTSRNWCANANVGWIDVVCQQRKARHFCWNATMPIQTDPVN